MTVRRLVLSVLATCALGCGPVEYLGQVTRRAATAVEEARAAGAERLAPYEFTVAREYLHKAREEAGYADFQAAVRFGRKSEEMARRARELSLKSGGDGAAAGQAQGNTSEGASTAPGVGP